MSGHSKWHSIKHKKGAADAKRGKVFTKLGNAIAIAAREGDDPETNVRLRLAIDKAKQSNMPNANIDKAIQRGSGQLEGEQITEVTYEGYGPGGVAIIVEGATDNRNRTYSDIRAAFSKNGGNIAETGAVAFQFDKRGIIQINTDDPESVTLAIMDLGVEDVFTDEESVTVYTEATDLKRVEDQLSEYDIESAELGYVPQHTVMIEDAATAGKVIKLMNALEDLDDVSNTYANFDIADGVI